MGCEFGQGKEWDHAASLDWYVLEYPLHQGIRELIGNLNRLYCQSSALHYYDFDQQGFEWIDCHDSSQSVLTYLRRSNDETLIIALNFTPLPRYNYRIGVPRPGDYEETLNSDSIYFGGSNLGNLHMISAESIPWMNRPFSINVTLPPLAAVVFKAPG